MIKRKTIKLNEDKLWKAFSQFIRLRDAEPHTGICRCFTCGRVRHWKEMDCGHGIPRQHKATKYSEVNNNAQCKLCNGFEGGAREAYKVAMDKKYGEGTWDKMVIASKRTQKLAQFEIDAMTIHYQSEANALMLEKNL